MIYDYITRIDYIYAVKTRLLKQLDQLKLSLNLVRDWFGPVILVWINKRKN